MERKENDWVAGLLLNEENTLQDFSDAGLTTDNTQFRDKEYYKNTQLVKDKFTDTVTGEFDNVGFDKFYTNASKAFEAFSVGVYDNEGSYFDAMERDYNNVFTGSSENVKTHNLQVHKVRNPLKTTSSMHRLGYTEESDYSTSEIAQMGRVMDSETGETLDWTANDKGGLGGFFREPLVLAQWDEDGTHEEDGRMVRHRKGDLKYNADGELCYETLGKRDASTKQVLSAFDTLTTDGSWANKLDIFDGDDKEQNLVKSLARTAARVAPVVLGSMIGGPAATAAQLYLGVTALGSFAEALPGAWKAIEGIATNNEDMNSKSGIWHFMNEMEAKAKGFRFGVSEEAQHNMWAIENLINLVPDIALQLGQQQLVAKIPGYLGKKLGVGKANLSKAQELYRAGDHAGALNAMYAANAAAKGSVEKLNNFGRALSTAYMTVTSGADMWRRAKELGHSDRTAGLMTLGNFFGLYHIMRSEVGQYALRGIGLDNETILWKNAINEVADKLAPQVGGKLVTNAQKAGFVKDVTNKLVEAFKRISTGPINPLHAGLNEAIEEVSEEMTSDLVVAAGLAASSLGLTREVANDFSLNDMAARYSMAAVGGALGGALHRFKTPWKSDHNAMAEKEASDFTELVAHNGAAKVNKVLSQMYDSGKLHGSKTLSAYNISSDGAQVTTVDSEQESQAYLIKQRMMEMANGIEQILIETGSSGSFDQDLNRAYGMFNDDVIKQIRDFGLDNIVTNQLNYLNDNIVKIREQKAVEGIDNTTLNTLTEQENELVARKRRILEGDNVESYVKQGLLMMNEELQGMFKPQTVEGYTKMKYDKEYASLSEFDKRLVNDEYQQYTDANNKDGYRLQYEAEILDKIFGRVQNLAVNYGRDYNAARNQYRQKLDDTQASVAKILAAAIDQRGERNDLVDDDALRRTAKLIGVEGIAQNDALITEYDKLINIVNDLTASGIALDGELEGTLDSLVNDINNNIANQKRAYILGIDSLLLDEFQNDDDLIEIYFKGSTDFATDPSFNPPIDAANIYEAMISGEYDVKRDAIEEYIANNPIDNLTGNTGIKYFDLINNNLKGISGSATEMSLLETISNAKANMARNPIYDWMDKVGECMGIDISDLSKYIANEGNTLRVQDINDYLANKPEELKKLIPVIEHTAAIITALSENESGATHGQMLNYFARKMPNMEELALTNGNLATNMIKDLSVLHDRLTFLRRLSMYNMADKLREPKLAGAHGLVQAFDMYTPSTSTPGAGFVAKAFDKLGIRAYTSSAIGYSAELIADVDALRQQIKTGRVDEELYTRVEKAMVEVERKTREVFEASGKTIEQLVDAITDKNNGLVSDDFKHLEVADLVSSKESGTWHEFDMVRNLLTTLSVDSLDFMSRIKSAVNATDSNGDKLYKYALLPSQMQLVKLSYAMIKNPDAFNKLVEKVDSSRFVKNAILNLGYQGTGKTSGSASLLALMLREEYANDKITASSIVQRQTDNIATQVAADNSYNVADLLAHIFPGKDISSFFQGTPGKKDWSIKPGAFDNVNPCPEIGRFIFIDEATLMNGTQLIALTEWAAATDRRVILYGDNIQQGASTGVINFAINQTPNLSFSMRSGSTVVSENLDNLRNMTEAVVRAMAKREDASAVLLSQIRNARVKVYNDDDKGLIGHKITTRAEADGTALDFIRKRITNGTNGKDIAVIYSDANDSILTTLKSELGDNITFIDINSVQGGEYDYVVSLVDFQEPVDNDTAVEFARKVNTVSGRAKYGTMLASDVLANSQAYKLANDVADYNNFLEISPDVFAKYGDEVNARLDAIVGSYQHTNNVAPQPQTQVTPEGQQTTPEGQQATTPGGEGQTPPVRTSEEAQTEAAMVEDEMKNPASYIDPNDHKVNGKVMASTTYLTFGMDEDGTIDKPYTFKDGRSMFFDMAAILPSVGANSNPTINGVNIYENGNVSQEALREYDYVRSCLAAAVYSHKPLSQAVRDYKLDKFAKELADMGLNLDDAKLCVFAKNYDPVQDGNNEMNNKGNIESRKGEMSVRLALEFTYEGTNSTGYITLADVYNNNPAKANDSYLNDYKQIASREITKNGYYVSYLTDQSIEEYGESTRINKHDNKDRAYSLNELKNSNQYVAMSEPHIYTGISDLQVKIGKYNLNPNDPDYATKAAELEADITAMIEGINLKGRPVVFVSKDPSMRGKSSQELMAQYRDQLLNRRQRAKDPSVPKMKSLVTMVALDMRGLSVSDFFTQYASINNQVFSDTGGKFKQLNTLTHKYTTFKMIKELGRYMNTLEDLIDWSAYRAAKTANKNVNVLDFISKAPEWSADEHANVIKEAKALNNLLWKLELFYGIKANNYKDKTTGKYVKNNDVLALDKDNRNLYVKFNPEGQVKLAELSAENATRSDLKNYYDWIRTHLKKDEGLGMGGVMTLIYNYYNADIKANGGHLRRAISNAFTGNALVNYHGYYNNGIELHPVYASKTSGSVNRNADFAEEAYDANSGNDFIIGNVILTGQNILINFADLKSKDEMTKLNNEQEANEAVRIATNKQYLLNLGLDSLAAKYNGTQNIQEMVKDYQRKGEYATKVAQRWQALDANLMQWVDLDLKGEPGATIKVTDTGITVDGSSHIEYDLNGFKLYAQAISGPKPAGVKTDGNDSETGNTEANESTEGKAEARTEAEPTGVNTVTEIKPSDVSVANLLTDRAMFDAIMQQLIDHNC